MQIPRLVEKMQSSTRGQVLLELRRADQTVAELAATLGLTENAIRSHLAGLERDGMVESSVVRRPGPGKPASRYSITAAGEELFPKGYARILGLVIQAVEQRHGTEEAREVLRAAGRLAAGDVKDGSFDARLERAQAVLQDLGATVEATETHTGLEIRGLACPLSEIVQHTPDACGIIETLVSELLGVPVRERCDRGDRPRCRFAVTRTAS